MVFSFRAEVVFRCRNSVAHFSRPDSSNSSGDECAAFVGVAAQDSSIRAVLANNEESVYDATLCHRLPAGHLKLGPYTSQGPRMVLVFGTAAEQPGAAEPRPLGFRAHIEFKTDFGVPGTPMGDSNECLFQFTEKRGHFNSPRYPANVSDFVALRAINKSHLNITKENLKQPKPSVPAGHGLHLHYQGRAGRTDRPVL